LTISNKDDKLRTPGVRNLSSIQEFYDRRPYPPPVENLDDYRRRWEDENRRRADFHLHWPDRPYRADLRVLVAGCGTSQAAKHALRLPGSQVVGIDLSETSIRHTEKLRRKYQLDNLELHQLPIERVSELGRRFDKIVCTGVLHHLPDPEQGLRALRDVLEPDGVMNLMVYAAYGRYGVYMIQEYCRRLGIGNRDKDIQELATTLVALPPQHPLARLLAESPDFQHQEGIADALLNPCDRAYSVPQLFNLLQSCELSFVRWQWQAPYLPQCSGLAKSPHSARLTQVPAAEQYAAVELFRGTMVRHSFIVHREEHPDASRPVTFEGERWLGYIPIRLPGAISVQTRLPPGASAVLLNQNHTHHDIYLPINAVEKGLVEAIDGRQTLMEILQSMENQTTKKLSHRQAHDFIQRLWWYDQIVFDISGSASQ
jgi:SAM-dependent methyltransferase